MVARHLIFFVSSAIAAFAGNASASASSFASTTIDWTQFSSTVALNYTDSYSIPIAEAKLNGVQAPQVRNDLFGSGVAGWGDMSAVNPLTNSRGYGYTTSGTVYAEGNVLADGAASLSVHASAFVGRGGYFNIDSAVEDFNFSAPYSYQHTLTLGSAADSAYAQSTLFLWLGSWDSQTETWTTVGSRVVDFYDTGASGSWSSNGTLTLSDAVDLASGRYAFDISAFAAAAATTAAVVPEPTTLLLLGIGLAGAGVVGRRRNRRL